MLLYTLGENKLFNIEILLNKKDGFKRYNFIVYNLLNNKVIDYKIVKNQSIKNVLLKYGFNINDKNNVNGISIKKALQKVKDYQKGKIKYL